MFLVRIANTRSRHSTASSALWHASQANSAALADRYQARHDSLETSIHQKILSDSPRNLDRITAHHRNAGSGRLGRKTGRASNRIKKCVPIRCDPLAFDEPVWFEADPAHDAAKPLLENTVKIPNTRLRRCLWPCLIVDGVG